MPTALTINGYRFFFYANEGTEPPHVHVSKAGATGKWWVSPVKRAWHDGFSPPQRAFIERTIRENEGPILEQWASFHNR
ncbi:MAG: DUF4160 domain-containing protein [Phycisphaerales bacterium]